MTMWHSLDMYWRFHVSLVRVDVLMQNGFLTICNHDADSNMIKLSYCSPAVEFITPGY